MPRSREYEEKNAERPKNIYYTYKYINIGSPSGCVRREIPGVTQVEKGYEGNTAVVTAYVGGNMEYVFHEE